MSVKNENQSSTGVVEKEKTEKAKMYNLVLHNDDYTPMEFVVMILMEVFLKDHQTAVQLMHDVDQKGKGIVGLYTREVAIMKKQMVDRISTQEDYPLKITIEEKE